MPDGSQLEIATTIAKASSSAVRQNGLTADETNTVNHVLERLTDNTLTNTEEWKPYGTVASVQTMHGEPQVTIIRQYDAATEEQPLVDVMDADMMRLGKQVVSKHTTRGRRQTRDRGRRNRDKRGGAPRRKSKRGNTQSTGGYPPETVFPGGSPPGPANPSSSGLRGTQVPRQRTQRKAQPSGPGNHGAITGRNHAHPGGTERDLPSQRHRRPAQKVAAGRPSGDAAGPDD